MSPFTFKKNQHVLYEERGRKLRPVKIVHHDPVSKSYTVQFVLANGKQVERNTVPEKLFLHPRNSDTYFVAIDSAMKGLTSRVESLERQVAALKRKK